VGTAVAGHGPLPTLSTLIVALYQSLARPAAHDPSPTLRMLRRLLHVSRHQLPLLAARPPKATYSNCDSPSSARSTTRSFAWRSSQTRDCSIWLVCHSRSKMGTPSSSFLPPHHRCIFQHHLFPAPPRCQEIKATIMRPHRRPTASSCCVVPGPLPLHQKTALRPLPAPGKRSPCEALPHQHWLRTASRRRPCPKKSAAKRHVWANPGACSLQTSHNRHIWQPFQSSIFPRCSIADHRLMKALFNIARLIRLTLRIDQVIRTHRSNLSHLTNPPHPIPS
jgi:hypothetical protein